jgi:hypothetical protein
MNTLSGMNFKENIGFANMEFDGERRSSYCIRPVLMVLSQSNETKTNHLLEKKNIHY